MKRQEKTRQLLTGSGDLEVCGGEIQCIEVINEDLAQVIVVYRFSSFLFILVSGTDSRGSTVVVCE